MKKLCFILLASSGFALLPPLAQSTREIQAVLVDARLHETLGSGEVIKEIIRNEQGYLIVSYNYSLQVDIHYIRGDQNGIGPAKFRLEFQQPVVLGM